MCSVVGYVGTQLGGKLVLNGLLQTEYRGYDSAGFVCFDQQTNNLAAIKSVGFVGDLKKKVESVGIDGRTVLGHTRWATHGGLTEYNAHPHFDCHKNVFVVHNGIIENYHSLKLDLEKKNHTFISQTDTEVIAHLWEEMVFNGEWKSPEDIVKKVVSQLYGAYALVIVSAQYPGMIFFARSKSPLCIGFAIEYKMIASDVLAFGKEITDVMYVPDCSYGFVSSDGVKIFDADGIPVPLFLKPIVYDDRLVSLNGYSHYMIKEIYEQKSAVVDTVMHFHNNRALLHEQLGLSLSKMQSLEHVKLVGCGASWHAGRIAQFFFEEIAQIPTGVHLASEFRQMRFFKQQNLLSVCISQSGETADTLESLRLLKSFNVHTVGLVNVATSSMVREADGSLLMHAGPEIAVASTKSFAAQIGSLYWLSYYCAWQKGLCSEHALDKAVYDVVHAVTILESVMDSYSYEINYVWGPFYAQFDRAICLGRNISYPFALEAALKLKEIDYIFAQCYPAGELKHGPLALIDKKTPVFVFSLLDQIPYEKLLSNVQEAKARGAHITAFIFEGQDELKEIADVSFEIPRVAPLLAPLAMNGVMLLLVCSIGLHLGLSIDKPRNLAKSVTVE